jgi:hypothetical protein
MTSCFHQLNAISAHFHLTTRPRWVSAGRGPWPVVRPTQAASSQLAQTRVMPPLGAASAEFNDYLILFRRSSSLADQLVLKHDYSHSLSFHRSCLGARISAHRLIRYPFADTSIVPFDGYAVGVF